MLTNTLLSEREETLGALEVLEALKLSFVQEGSGFWRPFLRVLLPPPIMSLTLLRVPRLHCQTAVAVSGISHNGDAADVACQGDNI